MKQFLLMKIGYTLQSRIKVRITKTMPDGTEMTGIVESTLGRFLFNENPSSGSWIRRQKHSG